VGVRGRRRGGGARVEECARVTVGADGRHSTVARAVGAAAYDVVPPLLATYYRYYRGVAPLARPALEAFRDAAGGFAYLFPGDGGVWTLALSFPQEEFAAVRRGHERALDAQIARTPALAARLAGAARLGPARGAGDLVNFFRAPHGPGWALVGDAGYHRDPITGRGIADARRSTAPGAAPRPKPTRWPPTRPSATPWSSRSTTSPATARRPAWSRRPGGTPWRASSPTPTTSAPTSGSWRRSRRPRRSTAPRRCAPLRLVRCK
jgi:hypothetical protein